MVAFLMIDRVVVLEAAALIELHARKANVIWFDACSHPQIRVAIDTIVTLVSPIDPLGAVTDRHPRQCASGQAMQLERLGFAQLDFIPPAVDSKTGRYAYRQVACSCHLEPMHHAKTVQVSRVPVTRIRVKLLLGDEIVFEQTLTVVVGGLARN
jgi:hypothetical protein